MYKELWCSNSVNNALVATYHPNPWFTANGLQSLQPHGHQYWQCTMPWATLSFILRPSEPVTQLLNPTMSNVSISKTVRFLSPVD